MGLPLNASAVLNNVDLVGNPPPPIQPSQGIDGVGIMLGCGESDGVSDVGKQDVDISLVTCGTELLSEPVLSTLVIVGVIASNNLVVGDGSTKPIDNLDPQSIDLDHPLDDIVEDVVAKVSSPNDNVVSDANKNVDGGHCLGIALNRFDIDLCDVKKVVLVESSNDLNDIIHFSTVASLGVQLTPKVEVFKRNEHVVDVLISIVYNAELKAQLALSLNNDDPSNWLEDPYSSACGGVVGDLVDDVDELQ
ncbi:hypothetical protein MA16_Dca007846 [Dendrobium catenatum]|uniref:Uncharacterized protein n=1 Tax=Dendrobium catenatum TaxID=906689 RepID=A0A2I0XJ35_9ASPA|nr:hypothetical protein MA16_Dca007846 [Dendrobium catenatum]